jgi:hypothetical protein
VRRQLKETDLSPSAYMARGQLRVPTKTVRGYSLFSRF